MVVARKHIPEPVIWDQTSILREIAKLRSQIAVLTTSTETPTSDTKGTVVRNVRDYEIIGAIGRNTEVLERIALQLSFLTDVKLDKGEY